MKRTFAGGRELARALRQLPRAVRQKVLVGAMLAGGGVIQRSASAHAPRDADPRRRKGKRLYETIKTVVTEQLPSAVAVNVTTNDPRAHLVEYGHQNVPRGPNRRRVSITRVSKSGRVSTRFDVDPTELRPRSTDTLATVRGKQFTPAKPFMRRAWEEKKERALRTIAHVLGAGIEIEARRLAGSDHSGGRWVAGAGVAGAT